MKKEHIYNILPILGVAFCLWYVKSAVCDVVYTDYVRIVNTYLPDVLNPGKFLVPDVLTRIPVNYLSRAVNVLFFGYRTTFDALLGVLSLGFGGWCLSGYAKNRNLSIPWFVLLMLVFFSLNKWEMLTNGTGWVHFLAISCFYYHFLLIDRNGTGREKKRDHIKLLWLPSVVILTIAGPYCAAYTILLVMLYGWQFVSRGREKKALVYLVAVLVPFLLYLWSNYYAVEDHAGAVQLSLGQAFSRQPWFFPAFLLKAMASPMIGEVQIEKYQLGNAGLFGIGMVTMLMYGWAGWANIRYKLYQRTILPFTLLVTGLVNHGLILIARWIFLKDHYGMSSRYALQYQIGMIGIVLTIGLLWEKLDGKVIKGMALFCAVWIAGFNLAYTFEEVKMAPYREAYGQRIWDLAVQFEQLDDDTLRKNFDYRRELPDSGRKIRNALEILKQNNLNMFRK